MNIQPAFEELKQKIKEFKKKNLALNHAREELHRSEQELKFSNQIAQIFLTIPDNETYAEVLQVVLEALRSKFGAFGFIDQDDGSLVLPSLTRDIWDQCRVSDKTTVFPQCLWGGIWGQAIKEKKSIYSNHGPFRVPEGHIQITRTMVVPVIHRENVIGILHIANKDSDYDEKDQMLLETLAGRIAPVLHARLQRDRQNKQRERAVKELKFNNIILSTQQETSLDGILVVDKDGAISSFNQHFVDMWGIPSDVIESESDELALQSVYEKLAEPDQFLARVQYLYEHHDEKSQDEIALADGRIFDRYSAPMLEPDAKYYGRVWYFRDITERKSAVEEIHKKSQIQSLFNTMLNISMQPYSLEEMLEHILEPIDSISWLALQSRGVVFLAEEEPNMLVLKSCLNVPEDLRTMCSHVPFGKCLCGRAASTREVQFASHIDERHENMYEGMPQHGHYCIPIISSDKLLGVLNLYVKEGYSYKDEDKEFLMAMANVLGGIIRTKTCPGRIRHSPPTPGRVGDRTHR